MFWDPPWTRGEKTGMKGAKHLLIWRWLGGKNALSLQNYSKNGHLYETHPFFGVDRYPSEIQLVSLHYSLLISFLVISWHPDIMAISRHLQGRDFEEPHRITGWRNCEEFGVFRQRLWPKRRIHVVTLLWSMDSTCAVPRNGSLWIMLVLNTTWYSELINEPRVSFFNQPVCQMESLYQYYMPALFVLKKSW